ncbi:MAG: two-component system phosphate regulon response regulator PhoB [Halioglobus sp.]|jgi:two-component system phosphate regulon response regulator PhoB
MTQDTILIVDDEPAIRDMIRMALERAGFDCLEAGDTHQAHCLIVDDNPNLVLLDWMLPDGSGIELLRRLKRGDTTKELPVIMLTARTGEDSVIHGLDVGADDYITKPFVPRELIARVKALLRRSSSSIDAENQFAFGELLLDKASHTVSLAGEYLKLGPTEFKLLLFFMSHPDRTFTRSQLLDLVWGANVYLEERTVDVHIGRLRSALRTKTVDYRSTVQTVRGRGYLFSLRSTTV